MKEQTIKNIIDTYLNKWVGIELNKLPRQIENEMSDPNQDKNEECVFGFQLTAK